MNFFVNEEGTKERKEGGWMERRGKKREEI